MDMIHQNINELFSEQEKKLGRQLLQVEHKLDTRIITLTEDLINIRGKIAAQPRLSKVEDEVGDLKRELQELRLLFQTNTQSTSKNAYVQEQVQPGNDNLSTPRFDASMVRTSARTPIAKPVVQKEELDHCIPPREPIFDNDYNFTDEDLEAALFIRDSHSRAEVVHIEDIGIVLTAHHLQPTVNQGFFFDDVIMAYAHISNVATDATSVICIVESRKLLGELGGIPMGCESPWVATIANKFVGHRMAQVPLNVHNIHWLLLVFNFDKEEIQVLNSIQTFRDEAKETALVKSIQACINEAVEGGLVTPPKPINITQWKTTCYTNIPQQTDGHSCGPYTLKYMLSWNGDQMTEDFTQEHIDIFCWKICSSLLRSDCNKLRKESYKNPITEEEYNARIAQEPNGADDDVTEIIKPDDTNNPDPAGAKKRKRGRPRKADPPINPVKKLFDTKITKDVEGISRQRKPSRSKSSPFRTP